MKPNILRAVADTLGGHQFSQMYKYKRLNTFAWDPQLTEDLTCYVIPNGQTRQSVERYSASRYWERMPQISLIFVKMIESGTQDEVDEYDNGIDEVMRYAESAVFLDDYTTTKYTYFVEGIIETTSPEEWMVTHQSTSDQELYAGLYIQMFNIVLREVPGDQT